MPSSLLMACMAPVEGEARRTASVERKGTTSCSLPAFTQSGRSSMSVSSSPSARARTPRGTSTSLKEAGGAVSVQRSPSASTAMMPAFMSSLSASPPRPSALQTCAVPRVGCPANGNS